MYLGGQGGTGKSQLIKALQEFAARIDYISDVKNIGRNAIVTMAFTNSAASLLRGNTLHSALGIIVQAGDEICCQMHEPLSKCTRNLFGTAALVVIDEVYMVSSALLGMIHVRLGEIAKKLGVNGMSNADMVLGGFDVLCLGDPTPINYHPCLQRHCIQG
jgi:hypothetical protein